MKVESAPLWFLIILWLGLTPLGWEYYGTYGGRERYRNKRTGKVYEG